MSLIDKYMPTQGGIGGLWNQGTSAMGTVASNIAGLTGSFSGWGDMVIYGGIAIVGIVLILIAYSFSSGKQSFGDVAQIVKAIK
jgi:hypothetical protein